MKRLLVLALFFVAPSALAAPPENPVGRVYELGTLLDDIALNAAQATRTTPTIATKGFSVLRLTYDVTRVAATDFKLFCQETDTPSVSASWTAIEPIDSSGTVQPGTAIYTRSSVSASFKQSFRIGVAGLNNVRCYPTATSAGGTDLMDVTGELFQ